MAKRIAILGSTGSIGTQTLDVIAQHRDQFVVEGLAAGQNIELLLQQMNTFQPNYVAVATKALADDLQAMYVGNTKILYGEEALVEIAAGGDADFVVSALVGSIGLKSTLAAIDAGRTIGLANKETLIAAGHIVIERARRSGATLLPIDSEHSAIFQCLQGEARNEVNRITLTASGGSFRDKSRDELVGVTVEQALQHPNWSMGAKITIDSATMMNKGLEVIEAHWLFDIAYDNIEVVIHPESIVHSFVEFVDTSIIAQLGNPDMRVPIQYALSYPHRISSQSPPLRLWEVGPLHFQPMDELRFPCMRMAYTCGRLGGSWPTVFSAANEIAVARFLRGELTFLQIEEVIERVLASHQGVTHPELAQILEIDDWARNVASTQLRA